MPEQFSCRAARITVVSLLICCCLPFAFLDLNSSADARLPHRVRLQRRYPTEKTVIGPSYIVHEVPAMPIDVKARYDKRRLSVQHGRRRLQARTSAIERFRRNVQPSVDSEDYVPLMTSEDRKIDLQCGSCSLVANSGLMRQSSLGKEIDQADCIFRMDDAPTTGYERDVGRRTTVRVVSYTSLSDVASQANTLLTLQPSATHLIFHGPEHVYSGKQFQKYLLHLKASQPEVEMYHAGRGLEDKADFELLKHTGTSRHASSSEFSTNMYTLMAMKDMCSFLTVYGMLPKKFCSENPGNNIAASYYKDPTLTACSVLSYHDNLEVGGHPLGAEQDVFNSWMKNEEIRFVHPRWE